MAMRPTAAGRLDAHPHPHPHPHDVHPIAVSGAHSNSGSRSASPVPMSRSGGRSRSGSTAGPAAHLQAHGGTASGVTPLLKLPVRTDKCTRPHIRTICRQLNLWAVSQSALCCSAPLVRSGGAVSSLSFFLCRLHIS